MFLTYAFRLTPSRPQARKLEDMLRLQCDLYNSAREQRIESYRKSGKSLSKFDQYQEMSFKASREEWIKEFSNSFWRGPLDRIDKAFQNFFRRQKQGANGGFPRFKFYDRFRSLTFSGLNGIRFSEASTRIDIKGLGELKVRLHRPVPSKAEIIGLILTKDSKGWKVLYQLQLPDVVEKDFYTNPIGIDVGLLDFATLSDGSTIPNPRYHARALKLLKQEQQRLSRCRKGSNRRQKQKKRVAQIHHNVKNSRATFLHQISKALVNEYDFIVIENLNVQGMSQGHLARSIRDVGWSTFSHNLRYKALSAGTVLKEVDAKYTSQECSCCSERVPKDLGVRIHKCPVCGTELGRDLNAALNILERGRYAWAHRPS